MRSVGNTCGMFWRSKMNWPAEEEVQVVDERQLILANHAVGGTAATGASHTA